MVRKISQYYRVFRFKLSLEESDELFLTFLVKKIKKKSIFAVEMSALFHLELSCYAF